MPSKDVLATTAKTFAKQARDATFEALPLHGGFRKGKAIKLIDGGHSYRQPVALNDHAGVTHYSTGYETRDKTVADVLESADFTIEQLGVPVVITAKDKRENRGSEAIVNLLDARIKQATGRLMRTVEAELINYDAAGIGGALETLDGVTAASTSGWLEEVAVGSQTNSVGGLTKGSYSNRWQNQIEDVSDDFGTNGINAINALHTDTSLYREDPSKGMLLLSPAAFKLYFGELQAQMRFASRDRLESGKIDMVDSNGNMVKPSSNLGFAVSGTDVSGYLVDFGSVKLIMDKTMQYNLGEAVASSEQALFVREVMFAGQMVTSALRTLGLLINAES